MSPCDAFGAVALAVCGVDLPDVGRQRGVGLLASAGSAGSARGWFGEDTRRFFKDVALLAHTHQLGFLGAVLGCQFGASQRGLAVVAVPPFLEGGIAHA